MNFFGHAHVALGVRDDAPYVLGAMLPDFASMCRARLVACERDDVAAGIALHHRTDDAFHGCPAFVRQCTITSTALEARGLPWGGARAFAHVGIEMLLDGMLLDDGSTRDAYLRAIEVLADPAIARCLKLVGRGAERWPLVMERLREHGLPLFYRDPEAVADRLLLILASRPKLAIDDLHRPALREAMHVLRREVEQIAGELVVSAREGAIARVASPEDIR